MRVKRRFQIFMIVLTLVAIAIEATSFAAPKVHQKHRARRAGKVLFEMKKNLSSAQHQRVRNLLTQAHDEEALAEKIMATGLVNYAEPDYLVSQVGSVSGSVNDPYFSYQWHHPVLQTESAWEETYGKKSVVVTVCDSGVETKHPDLRNRLVLPGYNAVDGSTNVEAVNPHGTAVTGLIVANINNSIGISGIAPKARVLPVRVSNDSSGDAYLSDIARCIRYGADQGSKIINVSYLVYYSQTVEQAAAYARSKGSLVVVAAGNSGQDISGYPDFSSFLLVAATDSQDDLADFSNYGIPIDVAAPGVEVLTTNTGGRYTYISGTSFSSPITAAVAALVLSVNSEFSPSQVENILYDSADNIGNAYYFGHGRINANQAVKLAKQLAPQSSK